MAAAKKGVLPNIQKEFQFGVFILGESVDCLLNGQNNETNFLKRTDLVFSIGITTSNNRTLLSSNFSNNEGKVNSLKRLKNNRTRWDVYYVKNVTNAII